MPGTVKMFKLSPYFTS